MKKIYFMRHGMTDEHQKARSNSVMGFKDIGLNEQGKKEVQKVIESLQGQYIEGIVCSDQKSATETAEIISKELKIPFYTTKLLRERAQGEYQGKRLKELYVEYPDFSITTYGKGRENLQEFMKRTKKTFERIINDFNWDTCLIISHKGFLQTMTATCFHKRSPNWYLYETRLFEYDERKQAWLQK